MAEDIAALTPTGSAEPEIPAGLDWTIERDADGEAMVCDGCGTTRTIDHIRYISPSALSCCPERKMIPVRAALAALTADKPEDTQGMREAAERLLLAMATRALHGRDHVPSMRDEQDAASALRTALSQGGR